MLPVKQNICGLILAAGLSSRMNEFKPLMPLRKKTLIENAIDSVLSGGAGSATVVIGYRGAVVETLLRRRYGELVQIVWNLEYDRTDMMHSIQIGCGALPECEAFFLLPGDMPVVRRSTFEKLLQARREKQSLVIFPTLKDWRKHPPLIDSGLIPEIQTFQGPGGLRGLWQWHEESIQTVPVDDEGVWIDLDTPKDYQLCRLQYEHK